MERIASTGILMLNEVMARTATRRTQAERTDATREALIRSAIKLLNSHGYAGATLALIAEDAGVSRGSILHQFGTRADLMAAVVRSAYDEELHLYNELIRETENKGRSISDWPLTTWRVLSRPASTAALEILNGSRSDPELANVLRPVQIEIERSSFGNLTRIHAIDQSNETDLAIIRVIVAAVRGLSIQSLTLEPHQLEAAVQALAKMVKVFEDYREAQNNDLAKR